MTAHLKEHAVLIDTGQEKTNCCTTGLQASGTLFRTRFRGTTQATGQQWVVGGGSANGTVNYDIDEAVAGSSEVTVDSGKAHERVHARASAKSFFCSAICAVHQCFM